MKIFALLTAFLPGLLMLWWMPKLIKKVWRVLVALVLAAFITGCASTSNKFDVSPCACQFQPLNTGNLGAHGDA